MLDLKFSDKIISYEDATRNALNLDDLQDSEIIEVTSIEKDYELNRCKIRLTKRQSIDYT